MKRVAAALLFGVALVASACSSGGPTGAQSYTIQSDQASPQGKNFQFSAFYPASVKARPGDTINFVNKGTGAPHTFTFGIKPDRSNSPPLITPKGENPAIFFNCFTPQEPNNKITSCPTKTAGAPPEYNGSGYWNVFFPPVPAPGPKSAVMKLSSSIKPGSYRFICVLHAPMVGTIDVVASDGDRKTQQDVIVERDSAASDALTQSKSIPDPAASGTTVAAGWSGGAVAVNSFYPAELSVKRGATVTWKDFSLFEPHTVTFGAPQAAGPEASKYFAPSGAKAGSSYTGGLANSGIFGGDISKAGYSLVFPTAGTYKYLCELHPGMAGTIKVT